MTMYDISIYVGANHTSSRVRHDGGQGKVVHLTAVFFVASSTLHRCAPFSEGNDFKLTLFKCIEGCRDCILAYKETINDKVHRIVSREASMASIVLFQTRLHALNNTSCSAAIHVQQNGNEMKIHNMH